AEELQVLRSAYEERRGFLHKDEGELRDRRSREAVLVKETSRVEVRLSELHLGRRGLEEAAIERHRVVLAEVVSDYHLRPQIGPKEEARAKELRDLIDRMGEINLM